jgi:hypothetical protein
MKKRK